MSYGPLSDLIYDFRMGLSNTGIPSVTHLMPVNFVLPDETADGLQAFDPGAADAYIREHPSLSILETFISAYVEDLHGMSSVEREMREWSQDPTPEMVRFSNARCGFRTRAVKEFIMCYYAALYLNLSENSEHIMDGTRYSYQQQEALATINYFWEALLGLSRSERFSNRFDINVSDGYVTATFDLILYGAIIDRVLRDVATEEQFSVDG